MTGKPSFSPHSNQTSVAATSGLSAGSSCPSSNLADCAETGLPSFEFASASAVFG